MRRGDTLLRRVITTIWALAPSRSALRRLSLVGLAALAVGVLMGPVTALAVHDTGVFELDGNIAHDGTSTYDWGNLFNASGQSIVAPNAVLLNSTFLKDYAVPDPTYFSSNGGGVKDVNPISNWGCVTINNPTPKDNLQNAYAAFVQVPAGAPDNAGDFVLYLGSERASNNGDSFAGFWLFKNPVACNPATGTFTGSHTNGDILVVSNYTNGGGSQDVNVYEWQNGTLVSLGNGGICGASTPDAACAIANNTALPAASVPWPPGSTSGILANTFVEAGVDLTKTFGANGQAVPCFSFFQAETRSSQQLTATLKDFAGGNFSTCKPPVVTTSQNNSGPALTVPVGTAVTDVANLSGIVGTPGPGTLTYSLYSGTSCDANGNPTGSLVAVTGNPSTVNVTAGGLQPPSFTFTPASAGTFQWIATYSGDGGRNQPSASNCGDEPLRVVDGSISLSPLTATNAVGANHVITATVTQNAGSGSVPAPGVLVNFSIVTGSATFVSANSCTTGAAGTCTITITSLSAGNNVINATATWTVNGVSITRTTGDNLHLDGSNVQKTFVDGSISLSPLTATNAVGANHTITATFTQDAGTGAGSVPAPGVLVNFSIATGSATFVSGNSCTTTAAGTCTITITSLSAGNNVINATATWTVNGVSITRTTGDNLHLDGSNVQKTFVDGSISLSPLTATNAVDANHVITATVTQDLGTGAGSVPAPGVLVNFSIVTGSATFVSAHSCTTGAAGTCTITITSLSAGTNAINATATWTVNGVSITRTTGDNLHLDGSNVQKTFVCGSISLSPLTATNAGDANHVITATVTQDRGTGAGSVPAPGVLVNFSIVTGSATFVSANSCTTGAAGTCTITITSLSAGTNAINATATWTVNGVSITRTTGDNVHLEGSNVQKTFVCGSISLSPLTATNAGDANHVITATVTQDRGTGAGSVPAPGVLVNFSIVTGSATFVSANSCTTGAAGTCTITITSLSAGTNAINATATWTVNGVSITRTTGDNVHLEGSNVQKTFVCGSISLSPLTATNAGDANHVITATVTQDRGTGAGSVPAPGVLVNFSIVTGSATFVSANSCTTGAAGTC